MNVSTLQEDSYRKVRRSDMMYVVKAQQDGVGTQPDVANINMYRCTDEDGV